MGWEPCDERWWPEIAASLGKPWPREAVLMDLRWWASRVRRGLGKRPGRPTLQARYGWTERTLRSLIASGAWEDPAQAKCPADVTERSSEGPAKVQEPAEKSAANLTAGPADVQPMSQKGPADVPTRVVDHRTPTPITDTVPPEETDVGPPEPVNGHRADWDRVHLAYLDALGSLGRRRVPIKPSSATGRALQARIRDHGADAIAGLVTWWATADHDRARFLRDGGHGLETLARASKCEAYLRMIAEGVGTASTGPPARAAPQSFAAMLAAEMGRPTAIPMLTLLHGPEDDDGQ